jgi:hypothetical protein
MDFAEGAVLGVTSLTAWRMLFTNARLKLWKTVLIFGTECESSLCLYLRPESSTILKTTGLRNFKRRQTHENRKEY